MSIDTIIISRVLDDVSRKDFNFLPTIEGEQLNILDIFNYYKTGNIDHESTKAEHQYTKALNGYYLKSYLHDNNVSSKIINVFDYELDELRRILTEERPLAVALSTTFIVSLKPIKRVVDYIRAIDDKIVIILGGAYILTLCYFYDMQKDPSYLKNLLTENGIEQVDYIVKETAGENTLVKIIHKLKNNLSADELPNVAIRKNNFVFQSFEDEDNDFENYSIRWDLFNNSEITINMPIQTGIGCQDKCKFCSYTKLSGQKYKLRSLEALRKDFQALSQFEQIKSIRFIDDDFTFPITRLQEICKIMIEEKLPSKWTWSCWARTTSMTEETVKLMKEAGCNNVLMGIESGSDTILKLMNKSHRAKDIYKAIEVLGKYDILSFGYFMCGYPGETEKTVNETINLINTSGLDAYEVFRMIFMPMMDVTLESAENGLEGNVNKWKHNTMNSEEALEHIQRIVYEVKESAYMPGALGPIRYLLNNNFSRMDIVEIYKNINCLWRLEVSNNNNDNLKRSYIEKIKSLVRKEN